MMESFTLSEFGGFLVVAGGILTGLILTIQKSKCSEVNCLCLKCKRQIPQVPAVVPPPSPTPTTVAP